MRNRATKVLLAVVCLAICLSGCAKSGPKVPVVSVSDILGIGSVGMINRYAGIVEAGETVKVNKDANLQIAEIAVEAGDAVSKGQVLFSYETESLSIEVERMQLEIEQMNNTITTQKSQITTLEKDQKAADDANKLQYTLQIQQIQLDIKETEYKIASKQKEIDQAKAKLADANVLSPVTGHIKEVNANGETNPQTGEPLPFISITQEGDFRVRGTVNEMNASNFATDMPVIIRSRTDDSLMWTGTVASVDWENPVQSNNMMMYGGPQDEMTTSSKYPFYVRLNSDDGLMLGQHVFIWKSARWSWATIIWIPTATRSWRDCPSRISSLIPTKTAARAPRSAIPASRTIPSRPSRRTPKKALMRASRKKASGRRRISARAKVLKCPSTTSPAA